MASISCVNDDQRSLYSADYTKFYSPRKKSLLKHGYLRAPECVLRSPALVTTMYSRLEVQLRETRRKQGTTIEKRNTHTHTHTTTAMCSHLLACPSKATRAYGEGSIVEYFFSPEVCVTMVRSRSFSQILGHVTHDHITRISIWVLSSTILLLHRSFGCLDFEIYTLNSRSTLPKSVLRTISLVY